MSGYVSQSDLSAEAHQGAEVREARHPLPAFLTRPLDLAEARRLRKRGSILIERTRHTPAGLVREFSTLGLATRRYQRRSFCPAGDCHPDRLDKTAYREVSLGEVGGERYMLLLPHTDGDPVLIERVVGVTNFADVSPLNL